MNPIMSLLPNDLIMKIIRTADGGRITHKKNMKPIFRVLCAESSYCEDSLWCRFCTNEIYGENGHFFMDDLSAMLCDRREYFESDEEYMDMVRNPGD